MKAEHVTVTLNLVVPDGHWPENITLPELAYRVATGLVALRVVHSRKRPATREEIAQHVDFLSAWSRNLAEFEAILAEEGTPPSAIRNEADRGSALPIKTSDPADFGPDAPFNSVDCRP